MVCKICTSESAAAVKQYRSRGWSYRRIGNKLGFSTSNLHRHFTICIPRQEERREFLSQSARRGKVEYVILRVEFSESPIKNAAALTQQNHPFLRTLRRLIQSREGGHVSERIGICAARLLGAIDRNFDTPVIRAALDEAERALPENAVPVEEEGYLGLA